ncbi:MAG: hypothetical protein MUP45_04350 [Candidatus Marinimicrobia bacterium]|nr:hypothetical protein [Candidatus Neomarinimicrobiota bacterium]
MPEREIVVSRKNLFRLAGLLTAAAVLESCRSPEPGPTPTSEPSPTPRPTGGPSPEISPTPTTPPTPEPTPKPTVVIETEGFGGLDELTEAERATASAFQEVYEKAARGQDLTGTVVLTRGDEEGEIGAFFRDNQNNPWSLVTREEAQVLEQVPLYDGVQAEWVPNEMRFEYLVEEKTFVYEPENRLLINEEGRAISQWNGETNQWEEVPAPTPEPIEMPEDTVYVTVQEVTGYSTPGGEEIGHIIAGKKFTILEEQDGWLRIRLEAGGEGWIQASQTAYYPEGQIPPTPEAPPYPACEVPHFGGRTPDRKTGYVNFIDNRILIVYPPDVKYVRYLDLSFIGRGQCWLRDTRVTKVDKENQVITFDLGGGQTVQREFSRDTLMIMWVNNVYRGMPEKEAELVGGNLCDIEPGDAVALIYPNRSEAISPNSALVNLWGMLCVQ